MDIVPTSSTGLALATADLLDAWLTYERQRGLKPTSLDTYRRSVAAFASWVQDEGLASNLRPSDILRYKGYLDNRYKPPSVNLKLSAVRAFFRWLVVTDRIEANPAAEVRGARQPKSRVHKRDILTTEEVVNLFATCDDSPVGLRDRAMLVLMAYCALRTVEIVRANLENLGTDSERMVLRVWGKGRDGADELAIIPRDQVHFIRAWVAARMKIKPHRPEDPLFVSL